MKPRVAALNAGGLRDPATRFLAPHNFVSAHDPCYKRPPAEAADKFPKWWKSYEY